MVSTFQVMLFTLTRGLGSGSIRGRVIVYGVLPFVVQLGWFLKGVDSPGYELGFHDVTEEFLLYVTKRTLDTVICVVG